MIAALFDSFSWSSFTIGALASWIFGKIAPVFLKEHLANRREKKKTITNRCDELCDAIHGITQDAANCFCLDYDREKSNKIRNEYHRISILINELNQDLNSFKLLEHQIPSKNIIDFRQAVTERILTPRSQRYHVDDVIVLNIYEKSAVLISLLRGISRSIS